MRDSPPIVPRAVPAPRRVRERKLEVERELAERGLLRGPRRVLRGAPGPLEPGVDVARLRPTLLSLGPVFAAFGRDLSLRADWLRPQDCLELAEIPDAAPPMPAGRVDALLAEELGRPPAEIFADFETEPFDSRLLTQSHRALLPGGERVVVKLVRVELEAELATELAAVEVLKRVFTGPGFADADHTARVFDGFRSALEARFDLTQEAQSLQVAGRDARHGDLLAVPQVYRELSSQRVLTVQWLPGSTIDEIAARPPMQEVDAVDLARRIGLIWLQMALVGNRYPIEADLVELPDGRLAVIGGRFASLPEASRVNLWNYVRATVEHFPDRAAASLLREVVELKRGANAGELRTRVRQVVPFRDGGWSTAGESLGEYAVLHWRMMRVAGFRARAHLDDFYQGLFWAARTGRRFMPQGDPLGVALRDFDWLAGWNQFRQLASPQQLGATAESYVESLVELPQKLNRILSVASDEGGFKWPGEPPARRKRWNASARVAAVGLAMAACGLLARPAKILVEQLGGSAAWGEGVLAAAFLVLGWTLLRAIRSSP